MDLQSLKQNRLLTGATADVARSRERSRQRRLFRIALALGFLCVWMWNRVLQGHSAFPTRPHLNPAIAQAMPLLLLVVVLGAAVLLPFLGAGRSPHVLYRSSEIDTSLADVKGMPVVVDLQTREVTVGADKVEMTAREFDLLAFLAASPRQVFSREQLLQQVWGSSSDWQSDATITEHVRRLRRKIEEDPDSPRWITTVRGVGYRFES